VKHFLKLRKVSFEQTYPFQGALIPNDKRILQAQVLDNNFLLWGKRSFNARNMPSDQNSRIQAWYCSFSAVSIFVAVLLPATMSSLGVISGISG